MSKKVRQHSTLRALTLAAISLLMTFIVGALTTVALFYVEDNKNTAHIQAGGLSVGAWLTELSGTKVCDDVNDAEYGKLKGFTDDTLVDLAGTEDSIFNITNAVPGLTQTAKIHLKSNAAFDTKFVFEIADLKSGDSDGNGGFKALTEENDKALASQISITITGYTDSAYTTSFATATFDLDEFVTNAITLENVNPNTDLYYTVTATFVNDANNNAAMNGGVTFDITVKVTQDT